SAPGHDHNASWGRARAAGVRRAYGETTTGAFHAVQERRDLAGCEGAVLTKTEVTSPLALSSDTARRGRLQGSVMIPGFNHNIKHKGRIFHIQTEDSGPKNPHIITHLF